MPPKWQTHRDVTGASVLHRVRLLVGLLEGPSDMEADMSDPRGRTKKEARMSLWLGLESHTLPHSIHWN